MNEIAISVKNLSKKYHLYDSPSHRLKEALHPFRKKYHREFWALREISFEVRKGESIGIIGQNGSGKSTLLQLICGTLTSTEGEISVNGRVAALLELGAGFNPEFTGRQNVYMNGALMGFTKEETDGQFERIAAFADIGEFIDQPVKTYSSGMYVRLAFAAAINVDPDILVVDEALSVGDAAFQSRCFEKIKGMQRAGKTIIFVTHGLNVVPDICTGAVLLDSGKILQTGKPRDVINTYSAMVIEREEAYLKRLSGKAGKGSSAVVETEPIEQTDRMQNAGAQPEESLRYGEGGAEVIYHDVMDSSGQAVPIIETGKRYRVVSRVKFYKDVPQPMTGMLIKTLTGIAICGASTYQSGISFLPAKEGDVVETTFEFDAFFNPGIYMLTVGVSELVDFHIKPLDRRIDARVVKVIGPAAYMGLVQLNAEINVTRAERK